ASDVFILNIEKGMKLEHGGKIVVAGGLQPRNVLYNLLGKGDVSLKGDDGGANCCESSVDGTVLAPERQIKLEAGLMRGAVISGKEIKISHGSSVRCPGAMTPTCQPLLNSVAISAQVDPAQGCAFDQAGNRITLHTKCSATVDCGRPALRLTK